MSSSQENQKYVIRIRQLETTITQKYEVQMSRKIQNYEQNITNLNR